jgi:hypothetical protein
LILDKDINKILFVSWSDYALLCAGENIIDFAVNFDFFFYVENGFAVNSDFVFKVKIILYCNEENTII